jgi:hypothetical protein
MLEKSYSPFVSYGQSKSANILFTMGLHKRFHGEGAKVKFSRSLFFYLDSQAFTHMLSILA